MFFIYRTNYIKKKYMYSNAPIKNTTIFLLTNNKVNIKKIILPMLFITKDYSSFLFFYKVYNTCDTFRVKKLLMSFLKRKKGVAFLLPEKKQTNLVKILVGQKLPFMYPIRNPEIVSPDRGSYLMSSLFYKNWRLLNYIKYIN